MDKVFRWQRNKWYYQSVRCINNRLN
jgi:hypothetical protein